LFRGVDVGVIAVGLQTDDLFRQEEMGAALVRERNLAGPETGDGAKRFHHDPLFVHEFNLRVNRSDLAVKPPPGEDGHDQHEEDDVPYREFWKADLLFHNRKKST
jgi:hypothetical protein